MVRLRATKGSARGALLVTVTAVAAFAAVGCQRSTEVVVRPEPAPPPLIVRPTPAADPAAVATERPAQLPPILYVDGVRIEEGVNVMGTLDPDRIERIEILKGAAAASRFPDDVEVQRGVILIYMQREAGPE